MERFRVDFTAFFVALFGLYAVTGYKTCVPSALQGYHIVSAKENAVFYFNIEQNKDKDLEGIYMQIKMDHEFISIESDKIKGVRLYLGYGNHIYVLHKISDGEKQFGLLYRTKITFDNETGIQKLINGSKIPFTDIENSFFWNDAIYFSSGSVTIKSKKYDVINAPDRAYKENIVYDIATGASYNDAVFGINSRQIVRQNCSENKKTPYCFMLASDGKKCHLINSSVLHDVILVPTSPVKKSTMLISSSITTTTTSSTTSTIMTTTSTQKSSSSTSAKASTLRTSPATSETKPKDEPPKTAMKQEATEDQKPGKSRLLPIILLLLAVLFLGALVVAMVSCVKYRHARHYMKDTRRIRKAKKRTTKTITGSVSNPSPQTESSVLSSPVATV